MYRMLPDPIPNKYIEGLGHETSLILWLVVVHFISLMSEFKRVIAYKLH